MFKIEMLPARHGDCLWIEYGSENRCRRILIDGGTTGTSRDLRQRIMGLPESDRQFELLVVTHIDADHIAGILKLIEEDVPGLQFKDVLFNGWRHLPDSPLESLGPVQGERLTALILRKKLPWNDHFERGAVMVTESNPLPTMELSEGMRLTLISPANEQLGKLKPVWEREVKKAGLDPGVLLPEDEEPNTFPSRLERLGTVNLPDIDRLADDPFVADESEANGSSIALMAEYDGQSVLLSGDAHSGVLEAGIDRMLAERGLDRLPLKAFKLPHHGSKANVDAGLLKKVLCNRYLVSTNGAYFRHPDDVAMARVIKYGGDRVQLYFNYCSRFNKIWDEAPLKHDHSYAAFYPKEDTGGAVIELD